MFSSNNLGVNDGPECKRSEQVMDLTLRGPASGKEAIYYKYVSLFSPFSLMNFVRSTYPTISNGVIRVFQVNRPPFTECRYHLSVPTCICNILS